MSQEETTQTRQKWLDAMIKIASPVLENLAGDNLKRVFPFTFHSERKNFAMLEALGRTLTGIAPWLELSDLTGEEQKLQAHFREITLAGIAHAVDPKANDYMNFNKGAQPLVDAAFLAHAIIRAPKQIAEALPEKAKKNLMLAFRQTREILAGSSNWLFFAAMIETALYRLGDTKFDKVRVAEALRAFQIWYKGDGIYGDGAALHVDYYNSFVIHPMFVDILRTFRDASQEMAELAEQEIKRAARYASVLERVIGPDGSYPIVGRSICYRFGAFHMLAQAALEHALEVKLHPAQVRCALTAVMDKLMENPDMFDSDGWLRPGVYGYQPNLAEGYINIGSLYLCTTVFLPLGLPASDAFWSGEDMDWSSKRMFSGRTVPIDHAINL